MTPAPTRVAYHAGRCAVCDRMIEGSRAMQEVRLHALGSAGTVMGSSYQ